MGLWSAPHRHALRLRRAAAAAAFRLLPWLPLQLLWGRPPGWAHGAGCPARPQTTSQSRLAPAALLWSAKLQALAAWPRERPRSQEGVQLAALRTRPLGPAPPPGRCAARLQRRRMRGLQLAAGCCLCCHQPPTRALPEPASVLLPPLPQDLDTLKAARGPGPTRAVLLAALALPALQVKILLPPR
jgi:hypothetical protein